MLFPFLAVHSFLCCNAEEIGEEQSLEEGPGIMRQNLV